MPTRRTFLTAAASGAATLAAGAIPAPANGRKVFRLWATGCAHVGTVKRRGRESLAGAIRQSEQEGPGGFAWDLALHVGDISGNQGFPDAAEGREVVRQFAALRTHRREQVYCLAGNHDADPDYAWHRTWVDPTGENPQQSGVQADRRPFPIRGTWERYAFRVGNLLFLMMSDRNDLERPVGRGRKGARGGYPAGAVTGETFDWWKRQVEAHSDGIILSAHHHMLKETTVGSGLWEGTGRPAKPGQTPKGVRREKYAFGYHGYFPQGAPQGASYLYFVDGRPDAQAFESYLAEHPGAIDLWIGGHTHSYPDDCLNGRTHVERKWGATFINCCALTQHHAGRSPMSRLLTFTEGSNVVRVQLVLHTDRFAPRGFCDAYERTVRLGKPFRMTS